MPRLAPRRRRIAAAGLAVVLATVAVVSIVGAYLAGPAKAPWLASVSWTAAAAFALGGLSYGARGVEHPLARRAWSLLALAAFFWFLGELAWDAYTIAEHTPSIPSVADVFWIIFAIVAIVALNGFSPNPGGTRSSRLSTGLDLTALYAMTAAFTVMLFYDEAVASTLPLAGKLVAIAYAALYVAVAVTLAQSLFRRNLLHRHPKLVALSLGVILEAAAFVLWTPRLLAQDYVVGQGPSDALWTLGMLSLGVAGLLVVRGELLALPDERFVRLRATLPTALFAVGLLLLPVMLLTHQPPGLRLVLQAGVITAGVSLGLRLRVVTRAELDADSAARVARDELARLFSLSTEMLAVISLDGSLRRVNPAVEQLSGYSAEELVDREFAEFVHPEDLDATSTAVAALAAGTEAAKWENRMRTKDGRYVPIRWSAAVSTEHGVAYAVGHDLTRAHAVESALRDAHGKAVDASRLKSDFLANMSHEIRTPLNGVIGMTELLRDTELSPDQQEYTDLIHASGDALLSVINDILDFSKIEAGKLEIERTDFDIHRTIDEACSIVAAAAGEKGIELAVAIDDSVPKHLHGDGGRIRQILINLATNAVKFTEAGEVVVRAAGEDPGDGAIWIRVEVSDTGIGIEPAALERLFRPFEQADSSTSREYGGTGLGLAITGQLVTLMGGSIEAASTVGRGSTFTFTLPLAPAHGTAPEPVATDMAGTRALVVDDNATNRAIMLHQLESWGVSCDSAVNGGDALAAMVQAAESGLPYEFVLLDFNMPGMNGVEVARAMKRRPSLRGSRILMVGSSGGNAAARSADIDGYLMKPVSRDRLRGAISRVMAERPKRGQAAVAAARPTAGPPELRGRVLLAEDNPVNERLAIRLLERRGLQVEAARNGQQAVDMHSEGDYDAIFMDCQMPVMDGFEATREIRRREQQAGEGGRIPIIAMTANSLSGDRERCIAAGMDDYLAKPLATGELDAALVRWTRARSVPPPVEADQAVDLAHLDSLRELLTDEDFVELVEIFLASTPALIARLHGAVAARDPDAVACTAHGMKGSAQILAATRMASACDELEQRAGRGSLEAAEELAAEVEDGFRSARGGLEALAARCRAARAR